MQRWRFYVKGSAAENKWLNRMAHAGWQLKAIHGWRYQFERSDEDWHVFSEYVKTGPVDLSAAGGPFRALTQQHLNKPDLWVVYTASKNQRIVQATTTSNPHLELAVDRIVRGRVQDFFNQFLLAALGLAILSGGAGVIYSNNGNDPVADQFFHVMVFGLGVMVACWAISTIWSAWFQPRIQRLTKMTGDYDGTWLPTWHVMVEKTSTGIDTDKLNYLGRWFPLVENAEKQLYYYDLQTNAGQKAIHDAIQKSIADPQVKITIVSWLGLGWG